MDKIKEIIENILDEIFPPKCIVCNRNKAIRTDCKICESCINIMKDYKLNISIVNEEKREIGLGILRYDGLSRFLIHRLKYKKDKRVASIIAELIYEEVKDFTNRHHVNYIIPIPIHEKRLKERRFNQSELIAKILAKRLNIIFRNDLIIRTKLTPPQSTLTTEEKIENVKDSFKIVNETEVQGKDIILFDDILTTGSTMEECSRKLLECNTRRVYFLTANISNSKIKGECNYENQHKALWTNRSR